jgi:hypothetical protein
MAKTWVSGVRRQCLENNWVHFPLLHGELGELREQHFGNASSLFKDGDAISSRIMQ